MKAARLVDVSAPIVSLELDVPEIGTDEALIKLHFAAINHRDLYISKGQYARIKTPITLGSDGCGVVVQITNQKLNHLIGKEVLINPNEKWGDSELFQSKEYSILGMPTDGTFAEYLKVKVDRIHLKPAHLQSREAAAVPLSGLTAFRALFAKGKLLKGERVLISGVGGGTASMAFQFALAFGAEIVVTSSNEDKIKKAIKLGAIGGYLYSDEDWSKKLIQEIGGIDLVIDSAGGSRFSEFLHILNPGGRIVFYGGTRGKIDGLSPQIAFWKQISILGSTMGSDTDFIKMLEFVAEYKVVPLIDSVFPLSQINQAFQHIQDSKQFGKTILDCSE